LQQPEQGYFFAASPRAACAVLSDQQSGAIDFDTVTIGNHILQFRRAAIDAHFVVAEIDIGA
jgi:hypothetical protein